MQARHPEDFPFDFRHLGILYVCDHDRDGLFALKDFEMFALWVQINMHSIQMYEFRAQLQAKTVAKMIDYMEGKDGETELILWVLLHLLSSLRCCSRDTHAAKSTASSTSSSTQSKPSTKSLMSRSWPTWTFNRSSTW